MILIQICPYLEASFQILGKKWNGLIIHYLSLCQDGSAHFTEIKHDLPDITPRALSMKLTELTEFGLLEKKIIGGASITISYELTEKGRSLADVLKPIQKWAQNTILSFNKGEIMMKNNNMVCDLETGVCGVRRRRRNRNDRFECTTKNVNSLLCDRSHLFSLLGP